MLTPGQDKHLTDSLDIMTNTQSTESQAVKSEVKVISNKENVNQFSLEIEVSVINVDQQTLTINDQSGQIIR